MLLKNSLEINKLRKYGNGETEQSNSMLGKNVELVHWYIGTFS
jgi:hypothetical protein